MARKLRRQLNEQFPEYAELDEVLGLAKITWPRYGLGAPDVAAMDEAQRYMLWLRLKQGI